MAFRELKQIRHFDRLEGEHVQLQGAWLGALSFHEPGRLKDERIDFMERAGYTADSEEVMAHAKATIEAMARIDAASAAAEATPALLPAPAPLKRLPSKRRRSAKGARDGH